MDEKAKRAATYVREFLGDPKNQDLLNHFDSEVRNAKYEGRTEGRVEGRAEGRVEGRAEGIEENKLETAKKMLNDGLSLEMINKYTDLDFKTLNNLVVN